MKIELNNDEYRILLDILYTADWVLNANKLEADEATADHKELEQKLLALAKENGFENLITYDEELESYCPTPEFDDSGVMDYIEEYDNEAFWRKLPEVLSGRDIAEKYTQADFEKFTDEEKIKIIGDSEAVYYDELESHGLKNLRISK
jgi:hypothetical protein